MVLAGFTSEHAYPSLKHSRQSLSMVNEYSVVILNEVRLSRWLLPPCRVEKFKLLGTRLGEDLKWTEHVNEVTSSCYKLMAPTRKVKNTKAAEQGRQGDLVGSSETTTVICVLSINVK